MGPLPVLFVFIPLVASSLNSSSASPWDLGRFGSLVVFGDSYSDDSRLAYFLEHNGTAPPAGWTSPPNSNSASGGFPWPDYAGWYGGARLYNYAVSGASCSNDITPRWFDGLGADFPDVQHYEVPAFEADTRLAQQQPGKGALDTPPAETVYAMWIGTNDLDVGEFLTDSQVPGTNLTSSLDCVFAQLRRIYDSGGRYFVLMNLPPLFLTPLLATPENGGVGPNHYWPDKPANRTQISFKMMQLVVAANALFEYRTPFEVVLANRFPGARFAVMDVYGLVHDIWSRPSAYLNGTAPANATGFVNHCALNGTGCVRQPSPDSYVWFDESHPSEQTHRILARAFVDVVGGRSQWATYWWAR